MTTTEIIQAPLLDILFDGRNKAYGAYALRRGYNRRLIIALVTGIVVMALFVLLSAWRNNTHTAAPKPGPPRIQVTTIVLPEEKKEEPKPAIKKPLPPSAPAKPSAPVAAVKNPTVVIVPDEQADKDRAPVQADMKDKQIAAVSGEGKPYDGISPGSEPGPAPGAGTEADKPETIPFIPSHSDPEYPGGQGALKDFFSRHLNTPDILETGDKKIVKIRFVVDKDGTVSIAGIETSGGNVFDKEVIRVCRKMPKWKPATQNGQPVSVSYVLPVTFIGVEQ